jgi:hypothetical protein
MVEVMNSLWVSMVGRTIALESRPVEFTSGTLTIVTSCPNWAVQFRQINEEIRHNINKVLGGEIVKKLRVRLDPSFQPPEMPEVVATGKAQLRPRVKVSKSTAKDRKDVLAILRNSFDKYFARNDRKLN